MKKRVIAYGFSLLAMLILMACILIPLIKDTNFGLDLQGGFEVLYEVKPLDNKPVTKEMVTSTYKTISKRIDVLGVTEPDIIIEGNNRIRVQLAGVTNKDEARNILSKTASLTFRDTKDNLLMTSSVLKAGLAKLTTDENGLPAVLLTVNDKDKFYKITNEIKDYPDNRIVIWLDFEEGVDSFAKEQNNCGSLNDSKCLSAATVSQGFASNVIIQGNFTQKEATSLVELINSGSIPTKLVEISSRTVGSTFGNNALNKTVLAGIIGVALIVAFMTLIYRFAGIVSGLGMFVYAFVVFGVFWLIGGTLTLPGIASLVLGIGAAIDASVLSFERMKEELWRGKSLTNAFKDGYNNSFSSILDANVTTMIAALIMFMFGESSIKGYATMLIISTIITMLVIVYVTKYFLGKFIKTHYFDNKLKFFINIDAKDVPNLSKNEKPTKESKFMNFNFLSKGKACIIVSSLIILIGLICAFTIGLNLSTDYRGGSNITVEAKDQLKISSVKKDLTELNYKYNTIEQVNEKTVYVKIDSVLNKDAIKTVNDYFTSKYNAQTEIGVVSNVVKKELTLNAVYAVLLSLIGIIIYVALRFRFNYAIAGIVALFHDAIMIFAVFAIFRMEISVIFIAAVLTIIGYSINDTVVIFDRIRENIKIKHPNGIKKKEDLYAVINISLAATLSRTFFTLFTVLMTVCCLMFFGTFAIINFNIALFIGLISGTYSTLFIAGPILYYLESRNLNKEQKPKKVIKDELDELEIKGINA